MGPLKIHDLLTRNLTARYLLALGAIALLAISGQILIQRSLGVQSQLTQEIRVASNQRLLSQGLGRELLLLQLSASSVDELRHLDAIGEKFDLLRDAHRALELGNSNLGLGGATTQREHQLFEQIAPHFQAITKGLQQLQKLAERNRVSRAGTGYQVVSIARKLAQSEVNYRQWVDSLIKYYEQKAIWSNQWLKYTELLLLALTLAVLIVEGLFVFRPAIARLRESVEKLEQSEGRQRAILENSPDAIINLDRSGKILDLNPSAERMFDPRRREVLGREIALHISGKKTPLASSSIFFPQPITPGSSLLNRRFEMQIRNSEEKEFLVEGIVTPTFSGSKPIFTAFFRDITKRKKLEEDLKHTVEGLANSNEELERFAYVASHDLQEPLRMVSSYVNLLAKRYKGKLDPDADDFIAFAVDGASRMQQLIVDLLAFSRMERAVEKSEIIDCDTILDQILPNLQLSIRECSAVINRSPLPKIQGNALQVGQLFQNLLGNAIKFRGNAPPKIEIGATQDGDYWLFHVRDNGIGLESSQAAKIFEVFQRLHGRSEYPGSGIGLAICKKIVESGGGRIWVESEPGKGATFFFTFPLIEAERPISSAKPLLARSGIAQEPSVDNLH